MLITAQTNDLAVPLIHRTSLPTPVLGPWLDGCKCLAALHLGRSGPFQNRLINYPFSMRQLRSWLPAATDLNINNNESCCEEGIDA